MGGRRSAAALLPHRCLCVLAHVVYFADSLVKHCQYPVRADLLRWLNQWTLQTTGGQPQHGSRWLGLARHERRGECTLSTEFVEQSWGFRLHTAIANFWPFRCLPMNRHTTVNNTMNTWERSQALHRSPHIPWPCVWWWLALPCARAGGVKTTYSRSFSHLRQVFTPGMPGTNQ